MSHIPIDFGRILPPPPLLLSVSWCDNVGVFHIVGMRYIRIFVVEKGIPLYEKFVLACLSRQISG